MSTFSDFVNFLEKFNRYGFEIFSVNLKELKRQPPNQFGHMLPYYKK